LKVVEMSGLEELLKQVENIASSLSHDVMEKASVEAADIITQEVQNRAPQGPTGNLKRSPITKKLPRRWDLPALVLSAIDYRIGPHAHLLEFGTSRMRARPFFRPAVQSKAKEALDRIERIAGQAIEGGLK